MLESTEKRVTQHILVLIAWGHLPIAIPLKRGEKIEAWSIADSAALASMYPRKPDSEVWATRYGYGGRCVFD
jgi:hypothetical protein